MAPETGKKYGPYELQGRLGGGGMGHVYLAWDARLHREVAIKLLHNEFAMPGMRERFLREARAASALNHPNICTIFDIGEQDGDPYLVMELLQGETLKSRIQQGSMQTEEIVLVAREVAEALGAAHSKGVIHRDIKPANIFLVEKPNGAVQAKVLDFGLAKIEGGVLGVRTSRSLDITSPGATVGTLAYMSPEQARGEVLDSRSDLFSLGVVLYEMATRQVPFQGSTSALVFVQLLNHAPEPIRDWNDSIPRDLEKIILKLMAKERTARFQTAHELDEALAKVGEKGGGWLRKAVPTVPLVRAADPVARDKRLPRRKDAEAQADQLSRDHDVVPPEGALRTSGETQVLRPVARVPRPEASQTRKVESVARTADVNAPSGDTDSRAAEWLERESTERGGAGPQPAGPAQTDAQGSGEFLASLPEHLGPPDATERRRRVIPFRLGVAALVLIAFGAGLAYVLHSGRYGPALMTRNDRVVLTEIDNRTGDKSLDETVAEGLQIALSQSRFLLLVDRDAYRVARHLMNPDAQQPPNPVLSRRIAERLHAKNYVSGYVAGSSPPYLLHVDLLNVGSNDVLTSAEERVPSLQQMPNAIDHVADALRFDAGEERESISKNSTPVTREATSNLDALHDLAEGEDALAWGKSMDALRLFREAAKLEPKFVQVHLRLTVLYRKLRAELESGESSRLALAASDGSSERTRALAQYQYEMNASGDYPRAAGIIRQIIAEHPHDSEAMEELARTLRLEGHFTEALQTAQQAYADDPFNVDAYTQAENALIGLDRFDAAAQLEGQVERLGLSHVGGALTSGYLEGRQDLVESAIGALSTPGHGFRPDWSYGIYLDNVGRLAEGAAVWRDRAGDANDVHGLDSAAAFLLSQGAIDRALLGDCNSGVAMARESENEPQGLSAVFNTGMVYALCGNAGKAQEAMDKLQKTYPQSFAVKAFYIADIKAAVALHNQDPAAALDILKSARQFDLISLTPFLRGRAHVSLHQVQIGIVDFQTALSHRGVPFIVGSVVYPISEIGVARAFADTGDLNNSASAYQRFLELWRNADPSQPLVAEARAHSR